MTQGYDITQAAVRETDTFQLRDAADNLLFAPPIEEGGEPRPVNATVYGPGSKEHARAVAKRSNRNIARLRKKGSVELSADDIAAEGAEFLASITVGFENLDYKGLTGVEMHKALYADRKLGFIADQVNEHIGAWGKFHEWLSDELSLYARQMAWLNAVPRDDKTKALNAPEGEEPVSRLKQLEADGIDPMMPPLSAPAFIDYLMDVGPTEPTGGGAAVIGWKTLRAWQESTGLDLQPWELRLLRTLSGEWLAESERARKPDCPVPWTGEGTEINREAVAQKVGAAFKAMAQQPAKTGLR